jgi:hypothetical protein
MRQCVRVTHVEIVITMGAGVQGERNQLIRAPVCVATGTDLPNDIARDRREQPTTQLRHSDPRTAA